MPNFDTLEPINSHNAFQIAWETTLKCNLDCSYCGDGHDNRTEHPPLEDNLSTIDFIIEYVNIYMSTKSKDAKSANLNIQGGESIFHPNIVEILEYAKNKKKKYLDWNLDVSLITNAVIGFKRWQKIAALVDYFTISFHAESLPKQHKMFKDNVLHLKETGKSFHVAILMHPKHWDTCIEMIEWCKANDIKAVPRQIDHTLLEFRFNYNSEQIEYITGIKKIPTVTKVISFFKNGINLSSEGRACCSGQTLCTNGTTSTNYVQGNNFKNWHCSVNKFFLYIRQTTGEIYTNKDCKMNLDSKVGVLGYLKNSEDLLNDLKIKIETNTLPDIICKKHSCWCGMCAPKASTKELYNKIMEKYSNANSSY
jgi:pyruvate-formate lyase-activating enzyme